MEPERWDQVDKLFQAALDKRPDERATFIAQAAVSDEVRREVVSLLSQSASGEGLLDCPPWAQGIPDLSESVDVRIPSGAVLGPYHIEDELGTGGMGVVYRARDVRLNRPVAIKFLADDVTSATLRRRFQREAQMASSLNHPHILSVYDAGEWEGRLYLITEFVDGGTLREWSRNNRSWEEVIDLLEGVADALAAAHEAGVLHRDIKPANILVSKSGYAKLADFGLAKLLRGLGQHDIDSLHGERTTPGAIIGTIAYMSPEQASGGSMDARSDIFSFGVVLHEAVAGRRPFTGDNEFEVLQSIRSRGPAALPPTVPRALRAIVDKALEKDPKDRYHSMREMAAELRRLRRHSDEISNWEISRRRASRRRRVALIACSVAIMVVLGASVGALWKKDYFWRNPLDGARIERVTDFDGDEADAAISPDGKVISFSSDRSGRFDAWISQIGTGEFVNVTRGRFDNLDPAPIRKLRFSGDGGRVWFQSAPSPAGPYHGWLVPVVGGDPHPFLTRGMEVAWAPDGRRIVYHTDDPGDPIFVSEPDGTNARRIYGEKPGRHCHHPIWSRDGRFIYFVKGMPDNELDIWRIPVAAPSAIAERITQHNARVGYPAWLDERTLIYSATATDGSGQWLYTIDVERRVPHRVSSGVREQYLSVAVSEVSPRRVVCTLATPVADLWRVSLSARAEAETTATPLTLPNVRSSSPRFGPNNVLFFLSSRDGLDGIWKRQGDITTELWKGRDGGVIAPPSVSPDGKRVCFSYRKQGRVHLSVLDVNGTNLRTLAETLEVRSSPSWSPDGDRIAVAATEQEGTRIYVVPVDGGPPVRLVDGPSYNPLWSPDGKYIVYSEPLRGSQLAVKAITLGKAPVPMPGMLAVPYTTATPYRFAPDGKSLIVIKDTDFRTRNFYIIHLETGRQRQLTNLKGGDVINSFDVSPEGRQIVFDRRRDNADIVLFELRQ